MKKTKKILITILAICGVFLIAVFVQWYCLFRHAYSGEITTGKVEKIKPMEKPK